MEESKLNLITQLTNNPEIKENIDNYIANVKKNRENTGDDSLSESDDENQTRSFFFCAPKKKPKHIANEELKLESFINNQKYSWQNEGANLLSNKTISFTHRDKKILKSLLLTPIPSFLRKQLWLIATGAKREMLNNPNYYTNLTSNYPEKLIPSPYINQIDLDIKRTFPKDTFFQNPSTLRKLRNVLIAYSRRNTTIGYTQGFNFIVGKIHKQIPNEVRITISILYRKKPFGYSLKSLNKYYL